MPSSRRLAVLAATLLGSLAAAAAPGQAAVPGLNISAYGDAQAALDQGAKQVRFFVRWSDFEPTDPAGFNALTGPTAPTPITDGLRTNVDKVTAAGATPLMVVLGAPAWAAKGKRPRNADEYATFVGELAQWIALTRAPGRPTPVYEVWNEPDDVLFWGEAPDPDFYTSMLKKSYAAIKAGDRAATVLTGPTTGNNYGWIEALYARGAKGSFDGVAVHTDTGCLTASPDSYFREASGRISQFAFLGYREVRASMLANGDDKPIWMTELGWSTTNGGPTSCTEGASAGKKPSGVNEADQATFLTKAYQCLALDPYVVAGAWFTTRDDLTEPTGENRHGLFRADGTGKPALERFRGAGQLGPAECGDFTAPSLDVLAPTEGQQFVDKLDLAARAADASGVNRISFAFDGGKEIRNFAESLVVGGAPVGLAPWQGSGALALGPHTIEVSANDRLGNRTTKVVRVTKVAPGAITATLAARFALPRKVSCKGRSCTFKGSLAPPAGGSSIGGKVAIEWQWKNKQKKFRKLIGGTKPASVPFTFKARLGKPGTWRVRLVYKGVAPYKSVTSKFLTFRVR